MSTPTPLVEMTPYLWPWNCAVIGWQMNAILFNAWFVWPGQRAETERRERRAHLRLVQ